MSRRWLVAVVGLVLIAAAVFSFAGGHHHDHGTLAPQADCAVCAWHLSAAADLPVDFTSSLGTPCTVEPTFVQQVEPATIFVLSTASRAPPILPV